MKDGARAAAVRRCQSSTPSGLAALPATVAAPRHPTAGRPATLRWGQCQGLRPFPSTVAPSRRPLRWVWEGSRATKPTGRPGAAAAPARFMRPPPAPAQGAGHPLSRGEVARLLGLVAQAVVLRSLVTRESPCQPAPESGRVTPT